MNINMGCKSPCVLVVSQTLGKVKILTPTLAMGDWVFGTAGKFIHISQKLPGSMSCWRLRESSPLAAEGKSRAELPTWESFLSSNRGSTLSLLLKKSCHVSV